MSDNKVGPSKADVARILRVTARSITGNRVMAERPWLLPVPVVLAAMLWWLLGRRNNK